MALSRKLVELSIMASQQVAQEYAYPLKEPGCKGLIADKGVFPLSSWVPKGDTPPLMTDPPTPEQLKLTEGMSAF